MTVDQTTRRTVRVAVTKGRARAPTHIPVPDAIYCGATTDYTQISNKLLRLPTLSWKAKGLIAALLSNREGWCTYVATLAKLGSDGMASVRSGLQELEKHGLLLRLRYRDCDDKQFRGVLWAYTDTPNVFNLDAASTVLVGHNLELTSNVRLRLAKTDDSVSSVVDKGTDSPQDAVRIGFIRTKRALPTNEVTADSPTLVVEKTESVPSVEQVEKTAPLQTERMTPLLPLDSPIAPTNRTILACRGICDYWNKTAGHIHRARYTTTLENTIKGKLKSWKPKQIILAIAQYVQVHDDTAFYYNHDWTLVSFLKQRNGAPKFLEGLDEEHDGSIWRDYQKHRHNHTSTTTARAPAIGTRRDVREMISKRFSDVLREAFIKDCYEPALTLTGVNGEHGAKEDVVSALVGRYDRIESAWERAPTSHRTMAELGPMTVLEQYVDWLGDQSWLTNRKATMFTNDTLFNQFFREYARNLGADHVECA